MPETALLESDDSEIGSVPFRLRLERTAHAAQAEHPEWDDCPYRIENSPDELETVDAEGPALFDQVVAQPETVDAEGPVRFEYVIPRQARELTERIDAQLADDLESSDDVIPSRWAFEACKRLIRRMAPHVALARRLKVAVFTEGNSGVSLVFHSLMTDRRLNLRIAPDGTSISTICTDERLDIEVREIREDDTDLLRELAQWVTSANDLRRHNDTPGERLDRRLADVVGVIAVGGSSRKTGRAFTDLLTRPRSEEPRGPES